MKRLISWALSLALILSMVPAIGFAASAAEYTVMSEVPTTIAPSDPGQQYAWYNNWSTFDMTEGSANYCEIVAEGYKDAGALHVYQDNVANNDMSLGMFVGGQSAGDYTVTMYVKGDLGLMDMACRFQPSGQDVDTSITKILGTDYVADWTEVSYTMTATADFWYFTFIFSKYNWVTDLYIDNLRVLNSSGVDILAGAGNFYTIQEVAQDSAVTGQWPNSAMLRTDVISGEKSANKAFWSTMYPAGSPGGTWSEWNDAHYGEIAANGYKDAGSLHLVSCSGSNTGVAIDAGMIDGQTYTLGLYAKGTVNTGRVLAVYGNNDPIIITDTSALLPGWNYYEVEFTANRSQLNILAADWGDVDIYIDNITLRDANGINILAGRGDFCTAEDPEMITSAAALSGNIASGGSGAVDGQWSVMYETGTPAGTWAEQTPDGTHAEIVAEGFLNTGALRLISAPSKNTGVAIKADMIQDQQYTLGLYAKGTSNSGRVLAIYGNNDPIVIGASQELSADWQYYEITFTADRNQINLFASDWGTTDIYVDNITLKGADGVDLLAGSGDFYIQKTPTPPEEIEGTPATLRTDKISVERLSHIDAWTPFFPTGAAEGNWAAWENESENETGYNYAEIAAIGKSDAGSLHFVRGDVYEHVGVAIEAGMVPGETYTLKAYVKGYAKTTWNGLRLYGNGDPLIASFGADGTVANNTNWTEVSVTFTANRSTLELIVGADCYVCDIYVDDLQLINSKGVNILGNKGNFSVIEEDIPDLAVISSSLERTYRWYWDANGLGGTTLTPSVNNNVEIIADGCKDPGALNIWQNTMLQDTLLTLTTTQAKDLTDGQTYTLSMNVKGYFANDELFSIYPAYINQDTAKSTMNIPNKLQEVLGISGLPFCVPEWTNITFELPYPDSGENGFTYLNLFFSQYTWGTHVYIDNVQVLDPNGNDVLGGAGNFMDSGSESYPIRLAKNDAQIMNSNTMYYMANINSGTLSVSNHVESGITAGDQNFSVTCNGTTQSASNKNVTMNVASAKDGMPVIFSITSTAGSVDMPGSKLEMIQNAGKYNIYDISVTNVGTEPETLTMGQQELGFVWGDSDGYTYTYTPAKKGTLNVAVESGDVSVILSTADSNGSGSLDVDAGETVTVQVIPARNANGGYIATDAVITSSFTEFVCYHEHTETVVVDPTLDSAGSSKVVCSDCGEVLSVTELPPLTSLSWNLTLADDLSVNFCINVDESIRGTATVTVNFDGEDTVYNAAELPEKITVKAAAAQMNDTITVTIANGGDTVTKTYTVKQYADTILAGSYEEADKNMVQAMLNYGGAAQTYFGHNTENPVSSELGTEAVPETTTDKSVSGAADGISLYSASLVFRNKIAVRFYFTGSTEGITFKVGEKEYSAVAKDGMSYVEIADILPQDLDQQITLTVTDAGGNVLTVVYGPMNYIVRMNSKGSENLQNLLKALYNYHLAAKAYTAE